jgi:hypothetical protein
MEHEEEISEIRSMYKISTSKTAEFLEKRA